MRTFIILLLLVPQVLATVTIHQVLYDPTATESGGEFVQLYNDDLQSVDISGWIIQTSSSATDVTFPDGTSILGEGYFLVTDVGWGDKKDDPGWPNASYEETMTLKNSDSGVALVNGQVVDAVGWGNAPDGLYEGNAAPPVAPGNSLLRTGDTDDNSQDFTESAPVFVAAGGGNTEIVIEVEVISADILFGQIDIIDIDPTTNGTQILPIPGRVTTIPITVQINSSLPLTVQGSFGNTIFNLNTSDSITYSGEVQINYTLSPDIYELIITAQSAFSSFDQRVSVEVLPLVAFSVDTGSFHFGNATPGSTLHISGDMDMGTVNGITLQNLGNTVLDFGVYGTDLVSAQDSIPISSLSFGFEEFIVLDENNQLIELGLEAGQSVPINIELSIPEQTQGGTYSGKITLVGIGE